MPPPTHQPTFRSNRSSLKKYFNFPAVINFQSHSYSSSFTFDWRRQPLSWWNTKFFFCIPSKLFHHCHRGVEKSAEARPLLIFSLARISKCQQSLKTRMSKVAKKFEIFFRREIIFAKELRWVSESVDGKDGDRWSRWPRRNGDHRCNYDIR